MKKYTVTIGIILLLTIFGVNSYINKEKIRAEKNREDKDFFQGIKNTNKELGKWNDEIYDCKYQFNEKEGKMTESLIFKTDFYQIHIFSSNLDNIKTLTILFASSEKLFFLNNELNILLITSTGKVIPFKIFESKPPSNTNSKMYLNQVSGLIDNETPTDFRVQRVRIKYDNGYIDREIIDNGEISKIIQCVRYPY